MAWRDRCGAPDFPVGFTLFLTFDYPHEPNERDALEMEALEVLLGAWGYVNPHD